MTLFIRIDENGNPASHPITERNLRDFFSDLDPNNPPEGFARFERTPYPELNSHQVVEKVTYELSNYYTDLYGTKTWSDVYHIRDLSDEEVGVMIKEFKDLNPDLADWVYDADQKALVAPIPKPNDGKNYVWSPNKTMWIQVPDDLDTDQFFAAARELGFELTNNENLDKGITAETVQEILNIMNETLTKESN
jgi:hypothetical protein